MSETRLASAIAKAFTLLEAIAASGRPLSLNELVEASGMPKPSAHRMLQQLEEERIVKRTLDGRGYTINERMARLALATLGSRLRSPDASDVMRRLVDRLGETCNLGVLDGNMVMYVERVECDQPLRMHLAAGSRVPIHATATGKLLLAHMSPAKRAALIDVDAAPALTPNTLRGEDLLDQLAEIAETGVSINREESMIGIVGAAVPVRDGAGRVFAGLAVHAPVSRFGHKEIVASIPQLRACARELEEMVRDLIPS